MRIADQALNRLHLLKAIRRWGPVARTDLSARVDLSAGSITLLTAELLARGLIVEQRETLRRPGRPRQHLQINAAGAVVVGATLAGTGHLSVAFIDLAGNLLEERKLRLGPQPSLPGMATAIATSLRDAIAASPFAASPILRVGIAIPALIDSERGNVHFMTTFPVGEPVPFAAPISAALGLPVTIENDMASMARAEHWFGRARELASFTLVHVGFTIGMAEYADGLPRSGANGLSTEFGHIKSVLGPNSDVPARACFCGGHGCLATYASMFGILEAAGELRDATFPPTGTLQDRFERFLDRAEAGDAETAAALDQAGNLLGLALANFINATNPGHMLVSFASARFLAALAGPMTRALEASVMPGVLAATDVMVLIAEEDWRWKGTAALALEQTYLGVG